jgi:signal transduction histidine kinase
MTRPEGSLSDLCTAALRAHLTRGGEETLHAAYELSRRALAEGLGVVEMAAMLTRAVRAVVEDPAIGSRETVLEGFESFALECFSPFELAHLGAREANAVLRGMNAMREEDARRIAHDLHDSAGQLVASLHLQLDQAARALGPRSDTHLEPVRKRIDEVEQELRRLSHELRPTVLDDLGLAAAVRQLGDGISKRSGLTVRVRGETRGRLSAPAETALYRIVQEALTNVVRHARARKVEVEIDHNGAAVVCRVLDDGVGFDPSTVAGPGLGLGGMRERVAPLAGAVRVVSAKGSGTLIEAYVPVEVTRVAANPVG